MGQYKSMANGLPWFRRREAETLGKGLRKRGAEEALSEGQTFALASASLFGALFSAASLFFWSSNGEPSLWVGPLGDSLARFLLGSLGLTAFFVPPILFGLTLLMARPVKRSTLIAGSTLGAWGWLLLAVFLHLLFSVGAPPLLPGMESAGGRLGVSFGQPLQALFGTKGALGLTAALFLGSLGWWVKKFNKSWIPARSDSKRASLGRRKAVAEQPVSSNSSSRVTGVPEQKIPPVSETRRSFFRRVLNPQQPSQQKEAVEALASSTSSQPLEMAWLDRLDQWHEAKRDNAKKALYRLQAWGLQSLQEMPGKARGLWKQFLPLTPAPVDPEEPEEQDSPEEPMPQSFQADSPSDRPKAFSGMASDSFSAGRDGQTPASLVDSLSWANMAQRSHPKEATENPVARNAHPSFPAALEANPDPTAETPVFAQARAWSTPSAEVFAEDARQEETRPSPVVLASLEAEVTPSEDQEVRHEDITRPNGRLARAISSELDNAQEAIEPSHQDSTEPYGVLESQLQERFLENEQNWTEAKQDMNDAASSALSFNEDTSVEFDLNTHVKEQVGNEPSPGPRLVWQQSGAVTPERAFEEAQGKKSLKDAELPPWRREGCFDQEDASSLGQEVVRLEMEDTCESSIQNEAPPWRQSQWFQEQVERQEPSPLPENLNSIQGQETPGKPVVHRLPEAVIVVDKASESEGQVQETSELSSKIQELQIQQESVESLESPVPQSQEEAQNPAGPAAINKAALEPLEVGLEEGEGLPEQEASLVRPAKELGLPQAANWLQGPSGAIGGIGEESQSIPMGPDITQFYRFAEAGVIAPSRRKTSPEVVWQEPEEIESTQVEEQPKEIQQEKESPQEDSGEETPVSVEQKVLAPKEEEPEEEISLAEAQEDAWDIPIQEPLTPVPGKALNSALSTESSIYKLPPMDLLKELANENFRQVQAQELKENAQLLQKTLLDFGVEGELTQIRPGPVLTRYEFEPAPGVKINRVMNLAEDMALALKAIAPPRVALIPKSSSLGIEVANHHRETVPFKSVVASQPYRKHESPLRLALGVDVAGRPYVADLAKMPHLLIAGATGAGKSVCINTLILSILMNATPEEVRLLLIDPKMLELSVYNDVPHLLEDVIVDPANAALALNWMVKEMETRYKRLARRKVRSIDAYNELVREEPVPPPTRRDPDPSAEDPLPYIVVIIDELADLMMTSGPEVEVSIMRLAQKARAAGIHLILATQRPSVNVITGSIKANFPCRISFKVASKVDSRTVLDANGAEILLGRGDMFFLPPGSSVPVRLHGGFIAEDDINRVVEHWQPQPFPAWPEESIFESAQADLDDEPQDELYEDAVRLVVKSKKASLSFLQRRLRIGNTRAGRLLDEMEMDGVVAAQSGNKARKVLWEAENVKIAFAKKA